MTGDRPSQGHTDQRLACVILGLLTAACSRDLAATAGCSHASGNNACPTVTLEVVANANNVLSALAIVSATSPVTRVSVSWSSGRTPASDLPGAGSPVRIPVLGLAAETTYVFTADGEDDSGNVVHSAPVTFATGSLPAGVVGFHATGNPTGSGLTAIDRMPLSPGNADYVTIVDGSGTPVWYYLVPDNQILVGDFQQQPDGTFTLAVNAPQDAIEGLNESVATYAQIDALGNLVHDWAALETDSRGNPVVDTNGVIVAVAATNEHEIRLRPDGSALLFGHMQQPLDLSGYGGSPVAAILGAVLERVTPDGAVPFAWNSLEYYGPEDVDTVAVDFTTPLVDVVHANAIDVMDDGNYLVSFRNLSQIVKIDATTGALLWRLGGAGISSPTSGGPTGDFTFINDPLGGFSCQHGARELPNGHIILFDDGNGHTPPQSRAAEYALDTSAMTATLVWQSTPSTTLFADVMGFAQRLSNGNTVVTYGLVPMVQEWDPTGTQVTWTLSDTTNPFGLYRSFRVGSLYSYVRP